MKNSQLYLNWSKCTKTFIFSFVSIFLLGEQIFSCTIFHTVDKNGHILVGRNFDFEKASGTLRYKKPFEDKVSLILRPHFGYGYLDKCGIFHYGIRLLFPAGNNKRYGIEFTKLTEFFVSGIVLEQRLFEWFNTSIGTVGYFSYGHDKNNIAGLTTNLGWEPDNHIFFKPFVTYRTDIIFERRPKLINSISIGFNFEF